jgi:hypothetical protein
VTTNGATPFEQVTVSTVPLNEAVQPTGTVLAENVTVPVKLLAVQVDAIGLVASCVKLFGEHATEGGCIFGLTRTGTVRASVLGAVPVLPVTTTVN